jgi:hypothetical protein
VTDTKPGADERRVRQLLIKQGVGPDAGLPSTVPPKPTGRPRDWLDDILDNAPTTTAAAEPTPAQDDEQPTQKTEPTPAPVKTKKPRERRPKAKQPRPGAPRAAFDSRPPSPRQSLIEAWDRIPGRLKWLAYHSSAAYLGWSMGLVGWVTYVTAWTAHGHLASPQAIFWYVVGAATLLLHHATRSRWWPIAWLAAVPASSTVVGVLLYGTPHP